jgi:1,4-alpha-glucan branching enzyme
MPYVEGFGTWPFGEEWLWEAIATSYLPLLDVLDDHPGRVTLSLTPVLCDQLEAPGALERCLTFLRDIRPASHALDLEDADAPVAAALERSAAMYAAAADALERRGDLLAAFAPHVSWTSAATHAILPLLVTGTGVRLQLRTGIAAHRKRFGEWDGGLWLPECAHAPWLDDILEEAGVRVTCRRRRRTWTRIA